MSIEIQGIEAQGAAIVVDGVTTGTHHAIFPLLATVLENLGEPMLTVDAQVTNGDINFVQQITGAYELFPVEFDVYDAEAEIEGDAIAILVGKYEDSNVVAFGCLDQVKDKVAEGESLNAMSMFLSDEDLAALPEILRGVEFPAE